MTFYTFMMRNYRNMDTPAGDLARDMFEDKERFPRNRVAKLDGWHQILRSYLKRQHAC
ncbi:MAG: sterile alpha motif-like domain-containing protein, partial [Clostridiales bacterium]|nr:sterile alpha motif-like domain-containing protein [Clostridiales bacterium]